MAEPLPTPATLFDLTGRVALVTGSSRGLGWAMARALAGAGARVILNSRDGAAVEARRAELAAAGATADAMPFDAAAADAPNAVARILDRHGRLDVLVSNAATTVRKPVLEQTDEDWDRVIGADLTAQFRLARAAGRAMTAAGWGRILFTSSINGMIVRPGMVGYATAKTGLFGLVRVMAVELAAAGVTVNALAPGYFLTDGNAPTRAADPAFHDRIAGRIPAGRWGRPEELAGAALYLVSPAASFTTGTIVTVDGGMTVAI